MVVSKTVPKTIILYMSVHTLRTNQDVVKYYN